MSQLSDTTGNFVFLGPNLFKNRFWGRKLRKLKLGKESASLRYHVSLFLDKRDNFHILGQNLPKIDFLSEIQETKVGIRIRILKIPWVPIFSQKEQIRIFRPKFGQKWLDSESGPPRYHVSQFSIKMDNSKFLGLNLRNLPNYMRYFGWLLLRVLQRTLKRLKWASWRWMELCRGACTV